MVITCLSFIMFAYFLAWIANHIYKVWFLVTVDYLHSQLIGVSVLVYRCSWTIVLRTGNKPSTGRSCSTKRYYVIQELPTYFFMTFKLQSLCDSCTSLMIVFLLRRRTWYSKNRKAALKWKTLAATSCSRSRFKKPAATEKRWVFIAVVDRLSRHCEKMVLHPIRRIENNLIVNGAMLDVILFSPIPLKIYS